MTLRPALFAACALALTAPVAVLIVAPAAFAAVKDAALAAAVASPDRLENDRKRDVYRHPAESLEFWGVKPGATVVDLQPGGGYWTAIPRPLRREDARPLHRGRIRARARGLHR